MTRQRIELRTSSPDETRAVARTVASALVAGDVVALSGELGAGKTCFVQGAAAGLGVADTVTSPTFTLVRTYEGRVGVSHIDVYRLDRLHDVTELGDDGLTAPDRVTFVEWGDAVRALLPPDRLDVEIVHGAGEDDRTVTLVGRGGWEQRLARLVGPLRAAGGG